MNNAMSDKQRGLGFPGFMMGAFLLVIVVITGLKVIPAYMQNQQIKGVFNQISNDPDMQKASVRDIRASYDRRASIDYITAIKSDEVNVDIDGGRPMLSASYSVKIPMVGNVSLFLEFKPSSAAK
jgi:hypothetical protein